ncbi:Hsp20/alpha crystallin family protein [Candidatus Pacearchaeota archaeon]|nr:Hsp20/alpha crystallin family protein [Candidatus Pacearchaeota archaeon]
MGIFNDDFGEDPFESIMRDFFGHGFGRKRGRRGTIIRGEEEDRNIDFIETKEKVFIVFELPGFDEKDVSVGVDKRELEIRAKKSDGEKMQSYLLQKLKGGIHFRRKLPDFINPKKFDYTMRNGILEITFEKEK